MTTWTLPSLQKTLKKVPAGMISVSSPAAVFLTSMARVTEGLRSTWTKVTAELVRRVGGDAHLHFGERVGDRLEGGARVVEGQDVVEGHALLGRLPGAPLAHAHSVPPAPAGEDEVAVRGAGGRRPRTGRRETRRSALSRRRDGARDGERRAAYGCRSRRRLARTHQRPLDDRKETILLHKRPPPRESSPCPVSRLGPARASDYLIPYPLHAHHSLVYTVVDHFRYSRTPSAMAWAAVC